MDIDDLDDAPLPWAAYIHTDPRILSGKPVVKGTRLAVDFILELLAVGWTEQQLLEGYPGLSQPALRAIYAYAAAQIRGPQQPATLAGA